MIDYIDLYEDVLEEAKEVSRNAVGRLRNLQDSFPDLVIGEVVEAGAHRQGDAERGPP